MKKANQNYLLDKKALSQLCSLFAISLDENFIPETQKKWLRKPHQERWDLAEINAEQRRFVLDWAENQGLFSAKKPSLTTFDKALILGAITPTMQHRLEYLKKLWMEGVRFKEIVWLTGERPLNSRVDQFIDRCQTEAEAARLIWQEATLPEGMRCLPVVFVAVPMKNEGGVCKRPNTEDTIIAWVKTVAHPCTALFISDQPFCGYQFAVVSSCLPKEFQFEVVGPGFDPASDPAAAAITLDSIARWTYQESLRRS